jgi:purine-binding chemotaxis protein CheW
MKENMLMVAFRLSGERYAIELQAVERVVRAVALTPLPGAPRAIRGVFSLQGRIVPVGDLRLRLGLPEREVAIEDQIVLACSPSRVLGVLTEGATEVLSCPADFIERSEHVLQGAEAIAGIGRLPSGLILIHDLARFLSSAEERALDEALHDHRTARSA